MTVRRGHAILRGTGQAKPQHALQVAGFNRNADVRESWWKMKRKLFKEMSAAQPNPAHRFFGELGMRGKHIGREHSHTAWVVDFVRSDLLTVSGDGPLVQVSRVYV